jgi:hypothetical protein
MADQRESDGGVNWMLCALGCPIASALSKHNTE